MRELSFPQGELVNASPRLVFPGFAAFPTREKITRDVRIFTNRQDGRKVTAVVFKVFDNDDVAASTRECVADAFTVAAWTSRQAPPAEARKFLRARTRFISRSVNKGAGRRKVRA